MIRYLCEATLPSGTCFGVEVQVACAPLLPAGPPVLDLCLGRGAPCDLWSGLCADENIKCNVLHCCSASSMYSMTIWWAVYQTCATDGLYFMTYDMLLQA